MSPWWPMCGGIILLEIGLELAGLRFPFVALIAVGVVAIAFAAAVQMRRK